MIQVPERERQVIMALGSPLLNPFVHPPEVDIQCTILHIDYPG